MPYGALGGEGGSGSESGSGSTGSVHPDQAPFSPLDRWFALRALCTPQLLTRNDGRESAFILRCPCAALGDDGSADDRAGEHGDGGGPALPSSDSSPRRCTYTLILDHGRRVCTGVAGVRSAVSAAFLPGLAVLEDATSGRPRLVIEAMPGIEPAVRLQVANAAANAPVARLLRVDPARSFRSWCRSHAQWSQQMWHNPSAFHTIIARVAAAPTRSQGGGGAPRRSPPQRPAAERHRWVLVHCSLGPVVALYRMPPWPQVKIARLLRLCALPPQSEVFWQAARSAGRAQGDALPRIEPLLDRCCRGALHEALGRLRQSGGGGGDVTLAMSWNTPSLFVHAETGALLSSLVPPFPCGIDHYAVAALFEDPLARGHGVPFVTVVASSVVLNRCRTALLDALHAHLACAQQSIFALHSRLRPPCSAPPEWPPAATSPPPRRKRSPGRPPSDLAPALYDVTGWLAQYMRLYDDLRRRRQPYRSHLRPAAHNGRDAGEEYEEEADDGGGPAAAQPAWPEPSLPPFSPDVDPLLSPPRAQAFHPPSSAAKHRAKRRGSADRKQGDVATRGRRL
jgi:hypothetical protein